MDVPAKTPAAPPTRPWRQAAILRVIRASYERDGRPPTIKELQDATGISTTSVVAYNLRRLQEQGLIRIDDGMSRGIRLVLQEGETCPLCGR